LFFHGAFSLRPLAGVAQFTTRIYETDKT
jgi:hypothetical protein